MSATTCPDCGKIYRVYDIHTCSPQKEITTCQADGDDYCTWSGCPQLRDGEPRATGRHCPLDLARLREMEDWA